MTTQQTANTPKFKPLSTSGQMGRVVAIMADGHFRTLRDIERECKKRFGRADMQSSISARLRDADDHGWLKQRYRVQMPEGDRTQLYVYRLTPSEHAAQIIEVAA